MKIAMAIGHPEKFARVAGGCVFIAGALVLLGWTLNNAALKCVVAGWPKMSPLTAFGFLASGFSLWRVRVDKQKVMRRSASQICAAAVVLIGLAQLGNLLLGWHLHFELLGFKDSLAAGEFPARMAFATALNFLLLGSALFCAGASGRFFVFQTFVLLAGLVSWLGCLRFLYGGEPLLPLGQMSFISVICFMLLTIGIFCTRTDGGLMALFVSGTAGGLLVRRLLPWAVTIPFLVGWVRWRMQVAGWFGTEAGIALFGLSNMILFAALIWRNADLLHRADLKIKRADELQLRLAAIVNSSDDAIIGKTLNGIITSWNPGAEKVFGYPAAETIGQPMLMLFPPDRADEERQILTRVARGESVKHFETGRVRKDGKRINVSVTISPVTGPEGKIVGASTIARDITERKLAEEKLRASEESFRTMANSISQLAWIAQPDGFIFWYNQRWFDYTGTTPQPMEGWDWQSVHDPQILPSVMAQWTAAIAAGQLFEMEFPLRGADGIFRRFLTRALPLKDADGKVVQWFGTHTDVDELKRVEDSLRESEANMAEAQRIGHFGSWELDRIEPENHHANPLRWSDEVFRIFGVKPSAFGATYEAFLAAVHPADRERVEAAHVRAWLGEENLNLQHRVVRPDGTVRWVRELAELKHDDSGRVTRLTGTVLDITERKQAEASLRESQALYHSLVEQLPVGVFRKNAEGRYVFVNSFFVGIRGETPEMFLGKLPRELPPHEGVFVAQATRHHEQIMRTGRSLEVIDEYRHMDGRMLFFQVVKSPVFDPDGKIIGSQGILFDVTARKNAEDEVRRLNAELEQRVIERTAELEAANKELEAFSYSVSHDLRAPLRAVNGFAGIVLEDFGPLLPDAGRKHLERIRNGGQQMGKLIDDLLAFSRLNRQPLDRVAVDAARLVQETLDDLKPQREGREIDLRIGALPPCHGDPSLLKQVWMNLLANAIKYSRGRVPAVIEIGCERKAGENIYFVRDNGAGFDMQYAHKLFGVFQRLHRADEFEGTGVGLAIVQRIIHRHGGRVWAEAVENQGATFYFTLEAEKEKNYEPSQRN